MKHSRNHRKNLADKLFQLKVKKLYPRCLLCGKPTQVAHHFFPKSVSSRLRYDLRNGVPLCNADHMRLHQSGDPSYEQRIIQIEGRAWYDELDKVRRELVKTDKAYYEEAISNLT